MYNKKCNQTKTTIIAKYIKLATKEECSRYIVLDNISMWPVRIKHTVMFATKPII